MIKKRSKKGFNRTDHLANERTFLAWIRTTLGIMAFGFVVEKFSFFIKQIATFLGKTELPEPRQLILPYKITLPYSVYHL